MKINKARNRVMYLTIFAMLSVMLIAMASCSKPEFKMSENTGKLMVVEAKNAAVDSMFMVGSLEVDTGEQVVMTSGLENGSVKIELFDTPEEQSADEVPEMDGEPAVMFEAGPDDMQAQTLTPGNYMLKATVIEKATGTVTIEVKPADPEQWNTAESPDDAGEKAGIGLFLIDPSGLSLGPVTNADFHYMEGVAEAHFGVAAVDIYVRKGLSDIDEGDISFDNNEYKYNWTVDIDGTEVKCSGNREGEATKSVWSANDYSYAVLAYGAGGDDDFGLSEEDLTSLFRNIQ